MNYRTGKKNANKNRKANTMAYESPITLLQTDLEIELEGDVIKAIRSYGIKIDPDELKKALKYDRGQYQRGFADGARHEKALADSESPYNNVLYINRAALLNRIAHECHYDSEHPLESYTKLLQIIQGI